MTEQVLETAEEVERKAQEARKLLLAEAGALGVTGIRKNASDESIRIAIQRKRDEIMQAAAIKAAEQKIKATVPVDTVSVRVLKAGDNRISTGIHIPGKGDLFHQRGTVLVMPKPQADALEARGFVEITSDASNE
jgi:acylphosphatase